MSCKFIDKKFILRILVIGLIASFLLAPALQAHAQGDAIVPNLDIVLVIDESGSMFPRGSSNDPGVAGVHNGWRFVMADMFIQNWLGIDQSGAQHRVGVVMFGSEAVTVSGGLTPVTEGARVSAQINSLHADMNGTDYVAALKAANNMLLDSRPDAKKAIIFLSDGWCGDENMNEQQCTNQVFQLLPEIKAPIYTIAFASDAFSQSVNFKLYKNLLEAMAADTGGRYFNPAKNEQDLFNVYETILRELLALPAGDPPVVVTVPKGGTDVTFDVEPNVYQIWITVFKKDAGVTVDLFRPSQANVPCDNSDAAVRCNSIANSVSYSIRAPETGTWKVHLGGEGWAQIRKIKFVSNLSAVVAPFQNPWPAGKPLELSLQVVDKSNTPIDLQGMEVSLVTPDGKAASIQPEKDNQLNYWIRYADTSAEGDYKILVNRPNKGDDITLEHAMTVTVKNLPWLRVLLPQAGGSYPVNLPLALSAQLMFGPVNTFMPDPSDKVLVQATVLDASGNNAGNLDLAMGDQGIFNGQVSDLAQGGYTADVRMLYTSVDGETLEDVSRVDFTMGAAVELTATPVPPTPVPPTPVPPTPVPPTPFPPTPAPTPNPCIADPKLPGCDPKPLIFTLLGVLLAAGAGVGGFLYYRSLPALAGTMEVNGTPFPLSGKRSITIGSDPKCEIFVPGNGVQPRHAVLKPTGAGVELTPVDGANYPVRVKGTETSYELLQDGDTIEIGDQKITFTATPSFDAPNQDIDTGDSSGNYSF